MNVNIYHKHKDIIITIFIIASRAYLQHLHPMADRTDRSCSCCYRRTHLLMMMCVAQGVGPTKRAWSMAEAPAQGGGGCQFAPPESRSSRTGSQVRRLRARSPSWWPASGR